MKILAISLRSFVAISMTFCATANAAVVCKSVSGLSQIFSTTQTTEKKSTPPVTNTNPRFFIIGETHGTMEVPEFFGDIVCNVANHGPVVVMLELAEDQTDILQAYVASRGTTLDKKTIFDSYIWDLDYADGRNSRAMYNLIEYLRVLKSSGAEIQIYGAAPSHSLTNQHYYELSMATRWSTVAAQNPDANVLILAGKFHAQLQPDDGDPLKPAASFLLPHDVMSFSPSSEGGEAWFAQGAEARVRKLPSGKTLQRGLYVDVNTDKNYTGYFAIGKPYSASSPALKN